MIARCPDRSRGTPHTPCRPGRKLQVEADQLDQSAVRVRRFDQPSKVCQICAAVFDEQDSADQFARIGQPMAQRVKVLRLALVGVGRCSMSVTRGCTVAESTSNWRRSFIVYMRASAAVKASDHRRRRRRFLRCRCRRRIDRHLRFGPPFTTGLLLRLAHLHSRRRAYQAPGMTKQMMFAITVANTTPETPKCLVK